MTRALAIILLLIACACATLPHAVERGIAYEYADCARGKMFGGPSDLACRAEGEKKCKEANLHKSCFYDYAWEKRP